MFYKGGLTGFPHQFYPVNVSVYILKVDTPFHSHGKKTEALLPIYFPKLQSNWHT